MRRLAIMALLVAGCGVDGNGTAAALPGGPEGADAALEVILGDHGGVDAAADVTGAAMDLAPDLVGLDVAAVDITLAPDVTTDRRPDAVVPPPVSCPHVSGDACQRGDKPCSGCVSGAVLNLHGCTCVVPDGGSDGVWQCQDTSNPFGQC